MVGIDVIDLKDPLLKQRTTSDLRFISHPNDVLPQLEDDHLLFLVIWAAKEAIFKAIRKPVRFSPKDVDVQFHQLEFRHQNCYGHVQFGNDSLLAVCSLNRIPYAHLSTPSKTSNSSLEVREIITQRTNLKVVEIESLPMLEIRPCSQIPISVSHHGKLLAYAHPALS